MYIRWLQGDGHGLLYNPGLNWDNALTDDEYAEYEELLHKLRQPPSGNQWGGSVIFAFSDETRWKRLIQLARKMCKTKPKRQVLKPEEYEVVWDSEDGQVGLKKKTAQAMYGLSKRVATSRELVVSNKWFPHADMTEHELHGFAKALGEKGFNARVDVEGEYPHEVHQLDPSFAKAFQYAREWIDELRLIDPNEVDFTDFVKAAYQASWDDKAKPEKEFKKLTEQQQFILQTTLGLADDEGNPTDKAIDLGSKLGS